MKEFFYVRHGQTDANLQGLMCGGKWDICLNDQGLEQAERAAQKFIEQKVLLSSICVSPMLRAQKTAEIIASRYSLKPVVLEELREWDIGDWDRVAFETVKADFLGEGEPTGGESRQIFSERVARAFQSFRQFEAPLLVVSHGAVWLALQRNLDLSTMKVENGIPYRVYLSQQNSWRVDPL
jgi:broad specificity phosphatase PhoE